MRPITCAWLKRSPQTPGVYVLRNEVGSILYVGKATNLRRRLRAHFARRRWRMIKPELARAAQAEWQEVARRSRRWCAKPNGFAS